MATIILRYSNRANFVIKSLDLYSDEIKIEDYLYIETDKLYYYSDFGHEVVAVKITDPNFRRALFGTNFYRINDAELEKLMATGEAYANGECGSRNLVFVGKFFEPKAKEIGDKTLAQCYAKIEEEREKYRKKCAIQDALLAIGSGTSINQAEHNSTDALAADIETFLKNRKKCLDALKPKKRK